MAGVVMNQVQTAGSAEASTSRTPPPSTSNTVRVTDVADRLLALLRNGISQNQKEIRDLFLLLSRGIDLAVANNVIPEMASELPSLLKQVCLWRNDRFVLTAIMMLMISMKGACRRRWFSENDTEELHALWNEIAPAFCGPADGIPGEITHCISTVMSRFYPRMKMGGILAAIETTPGYNVFVWDFHAAIKDKSPDEEVYLFVAEMDNTETSSCITSPQLVNFLLNGKSVDRRTCLQTDPGPQIPTCVTVLVKDGTNLLQAVGQFNGKYVIAVAFMSMISNPSCPSLLDYRPPVRAASDLDNDVEEGSSKISLNCPISFTRIVTPVKGHLCKHLQCFDFENYVDINSRRPSWRCPHCSKSVCFTDLRIDQVMAKVLKEVAANVSHVKISANGLWEAFDQSDDPANKQDKTLLHQQSTDVHADIMDLTEEDNDIDAGQETDTKPRLTQLQEQSNPSHVNTNHVHTDISRHMENLFFNPTHENGPSITGSNVTVYPSQTVSPGSNYNPSQPRAIGQSSSVMIPILQGQSTSQIAASSMQFQQPSMNILSNDHGVRYMPHSRHVTRDLTALHRLLGRTPAGAVNDIRQHLFPSPRFQSDQLMGSQDLFTPDVFNVPSQPAQQFGVHLRPSLQANGFHHHNTHQQQPVNHMIPNMVRSPSQLFSQAHLGFADPTTGHASYQQAHHYANAVSPQTFQVGRWTSPVSAPAPPPPVQAPVQQPPMSMTSPEEQRGTTLFDPQTFQVGRWTSPVPTPAPPPPVPSPVQPPPMSMTSPGEQRGTTLFDPQTFQVGRWTSPVPTPAPPPPVPAPVQPPPMSMTSPEEQRGTTLFDPQTFQVGRWTSPVPAPAQTPPVPVPVQPPPMSMTSLDEQQGFGEAFMAQEGAGNAPAEQNWRPAASRMRGSLSGQAYSEAFNQSIVPPTQPAQAATPPVLNTPRPVLPPHLQAMLGSVNGFLDGSGGSVHN